MSGVASTLSTPILTDAVFGGGDEQRMSSVTGAGPGVVAVGHDSGAGGRGEAAAWVAMPPDERTHDEADR